MPTVILGPIASSDELPRKRWTRQEVECLDSMELFAGQHYELIDGELINKMGKKSPHVLAVMRLQAWLISVFGFWYVQAESPIDVAAEDNPANEPEPDLVALRESRERFTKSSPGPKDILLAIEVADSSLSMDLSKKAALYARAGIPEYWVLDIKKRRMIVHREPAEGKYRSVVEYLENESVSPLVSPQAEFRVGAAFAE